MSQPYRRIRTKRLFYLLTAMCLTYLLSQFVSVIQRNSTSTLSFVDFVHNQGPNASKQQRLGRCDELLFVGTPASDFRLSDSYVSLKPAFDAIIQWSGFVEAVEGHSGLSYVQTRALHYLASRSAVHTVCETGYNVGHSAFNYLTANPQLVVHSFDIGQYEWTLRSAQNMSMLFPNRLFVHIGDSAVTVPKFLSENPSLRCSLIIIDGGHNYPSAKLDIENFASVAALENNAIVMDDYPSPSAHGPAWDEAVKEGFIKEFFSCYLKPEHKLEHAVGFAVGKVVAHPNL